MANSTPVIQRSRIKIIIALCIIALISTASMITMSLLLKDQEYDASLVNQAGRQRMLSQRIALGVNTFITQLKSEGNVQENTRSLIRESANLMLNSHRGLMALDYSDEIQALYFNGDPSLNDEIIHYTQSALDILNAKNVDQLKDKQLSQFDIENVNYLLFRLNIIVSAYENEAQEHLTNSFKTELIIWLLGILVLVLEYLYIFNPTLKLIRRTMFNEGVKHHRMQLAADSANLGIWKYNLSTQTLHWDKKMWEIFNESLPQENTNLFELFESKLHPDDKNKVLNLFSDAIQNKRNMDFTFRIITSSNTVKYIHVHSIIEYNHLQEASHIVGTNQDITDQKNKESALIEAKEKAEIATRIKGEFLASMSHEIRTPLNGVMGMLGLLKNTPLNHLQKQRITIALSSAQSLLALINDILDFSKIEANKMNLEIIDFDLNNLLAELVDNLAQLAENKNLELILDTKNIETTRVKGDPSRIRQLLTNLLANAIKFTNEGHVVLTVSLTPYTEKNWQLNFSVEDTGIGIPEDKQGNLFDAFSQVDASYTRKYGGTGLGLAIVKRLVVAMGGNIQFKSKHNQGSRFYGNILIEKSDSGEIVAPNFDVSQLEILIVDDNPVNLSILADQLTHWGIQVTQANSGKQAIMMCEKRLLKGQALFDIAILDMQMPHMDGVELGKQLKQDTRFNAMHLVMMTSMVMENDNQIMASIGFSAHFSKPVNTSDLFLALSVIGDNGQALQQAYPLITHDYLNSLKITDTSSQISIQDYLAQSKNIEILVVEDNPINQLVATDLLEELGFKVHIAEDGIDALSQLNARTQIPYCLILMDCQMPRMDGFETTQQIRSGKAGTIHMHTPIIAVTANTMKGDQEKCLNAGMNDFIPKPIEHTLLEQVLLSWLLANPLPN
ncbi:response regulator [Bermanella sp. WJH001]|uniref:response regulator n=1 Tax=Bermanella sp. WJH001 TaxID=3048005 RepID=UPI0024BDB17F|nr:response regulator [Bermanella sp. WJH001]MDJ1539399.1 response regulator [Bermanella sp. WJH001]